jgi:hypothetical protein
MYAFSGLNGSIEGGHKLSQVKKKSRNQVGNEGVSNVFLSHDDAYYPPEGCAVHAKQGYLRDERLRAMPSDKIAALSVSQKKNQGSQQINNGQRQAGHHGNKRHEIAVARPLGLVFAGTVGKIHFSGVFDDIPDPNAQNQSQGWKGRPFVSEKRIEFQIIGKKTVFSEGKVHGQPHRQNQCQNQIQISQRIQEKSHFKPSLNQSHQRPCGPAGRAGQAGNPFENAGGKFRCGT